MRIISPTKAFKIAAYAIAATAFGVLAVKGEAPHEARALNAPHHQNTSPPSPSSR